MKSLRGQSVIEFFVLVLFVFFIFFSLFFIVYSNIAEKNRNKMNLEIKEVAYIVQDEINLAAESADGYYREFKVPMKISERNYDLNITEGSVYVATLDGKFATALAVLDVQGNVRKGTNSIKKNNRTIILNE